MSRWRTLPVQLGGFFAVVITATLLLFSASIYMVAQLTEQDDDDEYEYSERELAEEREHLLTTIAIALPVSLAAAIGGGFILAQRALKSLERVIQIAEQTSAENLSARIPEVRGAGHEVERLVAAYLATHDEFELSESARRHPAIAALGTAVSGWIGREGWSRRPTCRCRRSRSRPASRARSISAGHIARSSACLRGPIASTAGYLSSSVPGRCIANRRHRPEPAGWPKKFSRWRITYRRAGPFPGS